MREGLSFVESARRAGVSKSSLYNHAGSLRAKRVAVEADELNSS